MMMAGMVRWKTLVICRCDCVVFMMIVMMTVMVIVMLEMVMVILVIMTIAIMVIVVTAGDDSGDCGIDMVCAWM